MTKPTATPHAVIESTPSRRFRRDIQGMRGLAILLVVAFHANWGLTGGYIGVDVFFVVSGFVIGRLLLDEIDRTGGLDLGAFFARRARRLLPALAVVSVLTIAVAAYTLNPDAPLRATTGTAIAASLFGANFYLYATGGGYFSASDESNPLLHTWSLSVEEQFYFLLPVCLLVVTWLLRGRSARIRRVVLSWVVAGAALTSFWLAWATTGGWSTPLQLGSPDQAAFYGMPTRFWQFAVGFLLVVTMPAFGRLGRRTLGALGLLGVGAILFAGWWFDDTTVVPGLPALLPVVGTALLIGAGDRSPTVGRVLGRGWLVRLGDLSYSWYLWHWPAIVYARVVWPEAPLGVTVAAVGSLVPAWLSYKYIEEPLRGDARLVGGRAAALAAVCILLPLLVAVGVQRTTVLPEPIGRASGCHAGTSAAYDWPDEPCRFGVADPDRTILLVGDSHADSLSDVIAEVADDLGLGVAVWSRSDVPVLGDGSVDGSPPSAAWTDAVLGLADALGPDLVLVANRSPHYVENSDKLSRWMAAPDGGQVLDAWHHEVGALLDAFSSRGIPVLWIATVPEFPDDEGKTGVLSRRVGADKSMTLADVERRRGAVVAVEEEALRVRPAASLFDPVPLLCSSSCVMVEDGVWLYRDSHHISPDGGRRLARHLGEAVESKLSRQRQLDAMRWRDSDAAVR